MGKSNFAPVLTPETIGRLHKELSRESRNTIDDMADYLAMRCYQKSLETCPGERVKNLRREKAREIIYLLVYHGYL